MRVVRAGAVRAAAGQRRGIVGRLGPSQNDKGYMRDFGEKMKGLFSWQKQAPQQQSTAVASSSDEETGLTRHMLALANVLEEEHVEPVQLALNNLCACLGFPSTPEVSLKVASSVRADIDFGNHVSTLISSSSLTETSPGVLDFVSMLSLCAARVDDHSFASVCMSQALVAFPDTPRKAELYARLAAHLNHRGSYAEALDAATSSISNTSAPPEAHAQLAYAHLKLGQPEKALEALKALKTAKSVGYQLRKDATKIKDSATKLLKSRLDPLMRLGSESPLWASLPALVKSVPELQKFSQYHTAQETIDHVATLLEGFATEAGRPALLFVDHSEKELPNVVASETGYAEDAMHKSFQSESATSPVILVTPCAKTIRHLNYISGLKDLDENIVLSPTLFWEQHLSSSHTTSQPPPVPESMPIGEARMRLN